MFGNHVAINGENEVCSAIVPKTLSKNIKTIPILIPIARFTPIPPLRFTEDTATAIMVKIYAETGRLQRL